MTNCFFFRCRQIWSYLYPCSFIFCFLIFFIRNVDLQNQNVNFWAWKVKVLIFLDEHSSLTMHIMLPIVFSFKRMKIWIIISRFFFCLFFFNLNLRKFVNVLFSIIPYLAESMHSIIPEGVTCSVTVMCQSKFKVSFLPALAKRLGCHVEFSLNVGTSWNYRHVLKC